MGNEKDIVMGHKRWNDGYSQGNKRLFGKNWLQGIFDPVFVARSRVRATKCDPLAKIWGVAKKDTATIFEVSVP